MTVVEPVALACLALALIAGRIIYNPRSFVKGRIRVLPSHQSVQAVRASDPVLSGVVDAQHLYVLLLHAI